MIEIKAGDLGLYHVQSGDIVYIWFNTGIDINVVTRVTKTLIIVGGMRFSKKTGSILKRKYPQIITDAQEIIVAESIIKRRLAERKIGKPT